MSKSSASAPGMSAPATRAPADTTAIGATTPPDLPVPQESITPTLEFLATRMVEAAMPLSIRTAILSCDPVVVAITAPSREWMLPLENVIGDMFPEAAVVARSEPPARAAWTDDAIINLLEQNAIVAISQDPTALLPPLLLATVDHHLQIGKPSRAMVAELIKGRTGRVPAGLRAGDIAALDAYFLAAALRPETSAAATMSRLRRMALQSRQAKIPGSGPVVADLTLAADVADWARATLASFAAGQSAGLGGVLLQGPPGTGKTLLAGAVARGAGVAFLPTNASAWLSSGNGHLGVVLNAITDYFNQLGAAAPAVGLIDELDSVPDRSRLGGEYDVWWTQVTNTVLINVDRLLASAKPILLLGCTNHFDRLDPALIRAGRFGRHIQLLPPSTAAERLDVLRLHLPTALAQSTLDPLLPYLRQQSQAELAQLARDALAASQRSNEPVGLTHLLGLLAPVDTRSLTERRTVALHEAGHAVVAILLGFAVRTVSLIATDAEGETDIAGPRRRMHTLPNIESEVTVLLAGRAADVILGGGATGGASDDLRRCAELLHNAHLRLSLLDTILPTPLPLLGARVAGDPVLRQTVEAHAKGLLGNAITLVETHATAITALSEALLEHQVLDAAAIAAVLRPYGITPIDSDAAHPEARP